jgi:hypothetical protein
LVVSLCLLNRLCVCVWHIVLFTRASSYVACNQAPCCHYISLSLSFSPFFIARGHVYQPHNRFFINEEKYNYLCILRPFIARGHVYQPHNRFFINEEKYNYLCIIRPFIARGHVYQPHNRFFVLCVYYLHCVCLLLMKRNTTIYLFFVHQ